MSQLFTRFVLGISFLLLSTPSYAETFDALSHVVAATVFSDRALVTREAKVHVLPGAHIIAITDLPAGFDEASLRVQGKASVPVKIGTVEIKHVFLTEAANTLEREKQTALDAKLNEKLMIEGEMRAYETREAFINRLVANGADDHNLPNNSKIDFTPEKWTQALNLLQTGMMETQKELVAHRITLDKTNAEITKLQAELDQVKTTQAKQRRDAHINIESPQDTELHLSITYQTRGATWRPLYDARLDTTTNSLELEQYGQVTQQTGEDWSDSSLILSTAQPANGSEMPHLYEWVVQLLRPVVMNARMLQKGMMTGSAMMAEGGMMDSKDQAPAPALKTERYEVPAAPVQATVQATEYASEFHVPGNVTLKSVNEPTKVFIATTKMKADLSAQSTPRLLAQAFLFAKVTNTEDYPFLSGTVAKYRDGTFIGNAALGFLRPKETADLSFGIDDRIKVVYQRKHESIDNPTLVVMGDIKIDRQYETKITNLHKEPVTITVFEQYPVSADPDVKSEIVDDETTPGYTKDVDNRQGVIEWVNSLNNKEEKAFDIGFRVKYPKDKQITGL